MRSLKEITDDLNKNIKSRNSYGDPNKADSTNLINATKLHLELLGDIRSLLLFNLKSKDPEGYYKYLSNTEEELQQDLQVAKLLQEEPVSV